MFKCTVGALSPSTPCAVCTTSPPLPLWSLPCLTPLHPQPIPVPWRLRNLLRVGSHRTYPWGLAGSVQYQICLGCSSGRPFSSRLNDILPHGRNCATSVHQFVHVVWLSFVNHVAMNLGVQIPVYIQVFHTLGPGPVVEVRTLCGSVVSFEELHGLFSCAPLLWTSHLAWHLLVAGGLWGPWRSWVCRPLACACHPSSPLGGPGSAKRSKCPDHACRVQGVTPDSSLVRLRSLALCPHTHPRVLSSFPAWL